MSINLKQANRAIIKLQAVLKVLSDARAKKIVSIFDTKESLKVNGDEYVDAFEAGVNITLKALEVDFETVDVEALVAALEVEPQ